MGKKKKSRKAVRSSIEQPTVIKPESSQDDPIRRITEWQDHRYDPGYYTGGNIHPLITARRLNKYGYLLIVGGVMNLILVLLGIRARAINWYGAFISLAVSCFLLVIGFKLIKGEGTRRDGMRDKGSKR